MKRRLNNEFWINQINIQARRNRRQAKKVQVVCKRYETAQKL
jgi:hypothetical protein